jgi:hypothetical protein
LLLAVAVNVTFVLLAKLALQVVGQLIPAGLLVTVPAPAGGAVTVNKYDAGGGEPTPVPPPQLVSSRADRADNTVSQNALRDFMGELLVPSPN